MNKKQIVISDQVTPYYITDEGKCFNSKTNKWLKGQINYKNGYLSYNIRIVKNCPKRYYAHRLVAQFFLNEGKEICKGLEVNHKDCNKLNNNVSNLEIITIKQNSEHMWKNKLRKKKWIYQFDINLHLIASYYGVDEAIEKTHISRNILIQELNCMNKRLINSKYYFSYSNVLKESDVRNYKNCGKSKVVYQFDLNDNFIAEFKSCGEAKRAVFPDMKRGSGHISECCRGKIKTYKGYIWKYKDDIV